ncbi:Fc receptor-like protein 3 isoform X1 [Grus americana]|uniref:Fc receptor-like protein 3 isoform X1 n=1 Tax=Grus americana TaxID=9117 RepID=UPI0024078BCC|nr:Fc receptor-like protein 3 isoform X1 [Grus americana]
MQRTGSPTSTQQHAGMARSMALLLWAQALGLTGSQPSQLTLDPPWTPVFTSEKVMLRCQGSGAPGPTKWYIGQRLQQQITSNYIYVSKNYLGSGSYRCCSPGAELSPPITLRFSDEWLVLQVPARVLLEGDTVPLRCRAWDDIKITRVQFFREQEALGGPSRGTELLLSPLQLQHGGRYRCRAIVNKLFVQGQESALVPVVVQELFSVPVLHLKGPAKPPEGAPLALGCLSQPSPLRPLAHLQHVFYRDEVVVGGPQDSPQLQLPAVGLSDSGNYSCEVRTETASVRKHSALVTVTVRRVPVSGVFLVAQPPKGQVVEGDRLVLRCMVGAGTGPLSFSWHRHGLARPLATGPRYELHAVQPQDSGRYHCTATNGGTAADSLPLWVTVLVPVANATITMARTEPSVPAGESLNLTCSVEAGTAPVTFTWLRDGQQLGSGPVLSLGAVGPTHAGTYQCLATNHLGTHRIFQVRSPVLTLSVTQPRQERWQQGTAVAAGLSVSLLLLLLLAATVGWHLCRRHRAAAGKSWDRDPAAPPEPEGHQPEPRAPPGAAGDEEVLYTHVVVTERGGATSRSRPAPPQEPTVVYAVLPAPHVRLRLPSDTYENVP